MVAQYTIDRYTIVPGIILQHVRLQTVKWRWWIQSRGNVNKTSRQQYSWNQIDYKYRGKLKYDHSSQQKNWMYYKSYINNMYVIY